jgi:ABC-type transporter Mla subunit MlaD
MTPDNVNLVVAIAAAVALGAIALAALIAAISLWRMSRDVSRVARSADEALSVVNTELPATLKELRQAATNLDRVSAELQPRVGRVDALLNEADASLQSLRATLEAAEDIVRGPAAALDRVQRTVSAAGEGLVRGADRLRRTVQERRR